MVIQVQDTAQFADAYSEADALGPLLRIFQVALDPADANATAPATNVSAAIPWARAAPLTIRNMSATCYFTGVNAVRARGAPIGLIASAWGGMRIQLFMSPAALAACPSDAAPPLAEQLGAVSGPGAVSVPGASRAALALASAAFAESEFTRLRFGDVGVPSAPSCLYYSMIAPFLALPVASLIWYQGEVRSRACEWTRGATHPPPTTPPHPPPSAHPLFSPQANVEFPTEYQCLQREMVRDWRASWARVGASPTLPFVYVGLSAWPQDDEGLIPAFRYAAEATTRELPRVGMAVAADIADPASPNHPIHPIWKAELGRRLFLLLDNLLYANASAPLWAPRPVAAEWDAWAPSWGEYHHGMTNTAACHVWRCGGVRVVFDRPVAYRPFYTPAPDPALLRAYDWARGAESGFRGWAGANMTTDWWQPLALSRLSEDGLTLFLNTTWIHPSAAPTILRFGWNDYPLAFPLESRDGAGLPVAPFNISVTVAT